MSLRALIALTLVAGACGPKQPEQPVESAAASAERIEIPEISDSNVGLIVTALNMLELQPSQLALQQAQDPKVRDFAQRMVEEYTDLQLKLEKLLASKDLEPRFDALSVQLSRNIEATLMDLQQAPTGRFDMAYILQQIGSHQFAVHTLDSTLIPSAQDEEIRAFLESEVRPMFADHLEQIEQIHQQMVPVPEA